jgi:uncharacterized protein
MNTRFEAIALRIFVGEDDQFHHRPLYESIVLKARELHLRGATVVRGQLGLGQSSPIHTTKVLRLAQDLPLIIEIVDTEEKIHAFLPVLDSTMSGGLLTMAKVEIAYDVESSSADVA